MWTWSRTFGFGTIYRTEICNRNTEITSRNVLHPLQIHINRDTLLIKLWNNFGFFGSLKHVNSCCKLLIAASYLRRKTFWTLEFNQFTVFVQICAYQLLAIFFPFMEHCSRSFSEGLQSSWEKRRIHQRSILTMSRSTHTSLHFLLQSFGYCAGGDIRRTQQLNVAVLDFVLYFWNICEVSLLSYKQRSHWKHVSKALQTLPHTHTLVCCFCWVGQWTSSRLLHITLEHDVYMSNCAFHVHWTENQPSNTTYRNRSISYLLNWLVKYVCLLTKIKVFLFTVVTHKLVMIMMMMGKTTGRIIQPHSFYWTFSLQLACSFGFKH